MQSKPTDRVLRVYGDLIARALGDALEVQAAAESSGTARFAKYRGREADFVEEVLGVKMWAAEREMFRSAFANPLTVIRSCRKGGKTHTLGIILVTFVNVWESIVVSSAPTDRQVKTLLWGEVRDLYASAREPLLGSPDVAQVKIGPKHYAIGFSTDKADRMQGFHAGVVPPTDDPDRDLTDDEIAQALAAVAAGFDDDTASSRRLVFLFDEAPGIAQYLFDAVHGSMSGPNTRLVLAGNPTMSSDADHEFARAFDEGSGYHRIHIAAEPCPDDLVPADVVFDHVPNWLLDQEWIDSRKKRWGDASVMWQAYGRGMFASDSSECRVIPLDLLESALTRTVFADVGRHIGVDIARMGKDSCVASLWVHGVKRAWYEWQHTDLMATADIIQALRVRWAGEDVLGDELPPVPPECVHVDETGLGAGVVDRLMQMGTPVDGVDFGAGPVYDWQELTGEMLFLNRRAELHWILRRALQEGLAQMPKKLHGEVNPSWQQALWPEYEVKDAIGGSKLKVKPKDDIKKAHGKSPDHLDSDLLAWSRSAAVPVFGLG